MRQGRLALEMERFVGVEPAGREFGVITRRIVSFEDQHRHAFARVEIPFVECAKLELACCRCREF